MVKKASQLGAKGSFVQLTRREKDGSLVPNSANAEVEDDAGASASQPDPTPSFITQVSMSYNQRELHNGLPPQPDSCSRCTHCSCRIISVRGPRTAGASAIDQRVEIFAYHRDRELMFSVGHNAEWGTRSGGCPPGSEQQWRC
jgi:hypothetical protein